MSEFISGRNRQILQLRKQGKTYKEIAFVFSISASRAHQIISSINKKNKNHCYYKWPLTKRIVSVLVAEGYVTKKMVIRGIKNGKINHFMNPNYGKRSHEIVLKWIGIDGK